MKNKLLFFTILPFLLVSTNHTSVSDLNWLSKWFNAWALLAKVMNLPPAEPPVMLFYDEKFIYTTSKISAPKGQPFNGPLFLGQKLPWLKAEHGDSLIIPDGQKSLYD